MTSDPFVHFDGAYVLGVLPPDERAAFEAHLLTCDECAARVRELEPMPALLGRLGEANLRMLDVEDPVPDTLLPRLLKAARARRRRGGALVAGLVGAVAACAVALAVVLWPSSTPRPAPAVAMHALRAGVPVHATVRLVSKSWGTDVQMHCTYAERPGDHTDQRVPYVLVVSGVNGVQQRIGSWTLGPGESETFHSPTSLRVGQIDRLVLEVAGDRPVLELDL
jgi:hypothetical protein